MSKKKSDDDEIEMSYDDAEARAIVPPAMYLRRDADEILSTSQVELEPTQAQLIVALRASAEKMCDARKYSEIQRAWLDEACLRRHARATKWILADAEALLEKVLTYRDTREIWTLRNVDDGERSARVGDQVRSGKCYRNGFDKSGRPIIYMRDRRNRRHDGYNKKYPDILLHLMNCLEQATRTMALDRGVEQWVFVIDMAGFSLLGGDEMQHSRDSIDIFNSVYAERLGVAFVLNAPWYFNVFYKLMAPFIDPETKAKFKVLNGDAKDQLAELLTVIDKSVLESVFGGDNNCKFKFDEYYAEETKQIHQWYAHEAKLATANTDAADDDDDGAADDVETKLSPSGRRKIKKKRTKVAK